MSLTEKWERFKAEQKDPTLVVTEDAPVIRESQTTEKMSDNFTKMSDNFRPPIQQEIDKLKQAVESTTSQMTVEKIAYIGETFVEKPVIAPLWAGTSLDVLKLVFDRVEQHTRVINQMTEQMERDGIQYSVRRHLMQARHAEAYAIFKLLGQDNADKNT